MNTYIVSFYIGWPTDNWETTGLVSAESVEEAARRIGAKRDISKKGDSLGGYFIEKKDKKIEIDFRKIKEIESPEGLLEKVW